MTFSSISEVNIAFGQSDCDIPPFLTVAESGQGLCSDAVPCFTDSGDLTHRGFTGML